MPATPIARQMDNPYYDWSPISRRPALRWPNGAHIAVAVVVTLEHFNWYPPSGTIVPQLLRRSVPVYPLRPDIHSPLNSNTATGSVYSESRRSLKNMAFLRRWRWTRR